jgi:hypothetical protein
VKKKVTNPDNVNDSAIDDNEKAGVEVCVDAEIIEEALEDGTKENIAEYFEEALQGIINDHIVNGVI